MLTKREKGLLVALGVVVFGYVLYWLARFVLFFAAIWILISYFS